MVSKSTKWEITKDIKVTTEKSLRSSEPSGRIKKCGGKRRVWWAESETVWSNISTVFIVLNLGHWVTLSWKKFFRKYFTRKKVEMARHVLSKNGEKRTLKQVPKWQTEGFLGGPGDQDRTGEECEEAAAAAENQGLPWTCAQCMMDAGLNKGPVWIGKLGWFTQNCTLSIQPGLSECIHSVFKIALHFFLLPVLFSCVNFYLGLTDD